MRKDAPGLSPGFSLVELSIALAVAAILAGLALPAMRDLVETQRSAAALHLLSSELALARNTAIMRRTPVTLCPSLGDGRCRTDSDWSAGWLLYRDPKRASQPASSDDILQDVRQPLHPTVRVQTSAGRLRMRYQPEGFSGGSNLTMKVCAGADLRGEVIVSNAGRPRVERHGKGVPCPFP